MSENRWSQFAVATLAVNVLLVSPFSWNFDGCSSGCFSSLLQKKYFQVSLLNETPL